MRTNKIIVTHRGTNSKIKGIREDMKIRANKSKGTTLWDKTWEDTETVVWVSRGQPNWWNRLNSGMMGKNGVASVTFEIEENRLRKPNRLKRIFGKSQLVIDGDVDLPPDSQFRYKDE